MKRVASLAGPSLCHGVGGQRSSFREILQRWRASCNTVSDLTDPRFEPETSRFRDERVTARPTGR